MSAVSIGTLAAEEGDGWQMLRCNLEAEPWIGDGGTKLEKHICGKVLKTFKGSKTRHKALLGHLDRISYPPRVA